MIVKCPICQSTEYGVLGTCRCGYNFTEDKISDKDKTVAYFKKLKETKHWIEPARFIKNLNEFQQRKKGEPRVGGVRGGWRYKDTAELIKENPSIVSDNINLVKDSEEYPELLNYDNRAQALRHRKNYARGIISIRYKKYDSEEKLQQYLETNWEMTTFGEEWELRESHINAGEAGEIDLLAHHRTEDCWLVVELKRDSARVQTISQILQYMGWFKENRVGKTEKVKGVIISGWPPDKKLTYALSLTPDIHQ